MNYSGQSTTLSDQAGVSRKYTIDGLGGTTQVVENGISATTSYSYDVLGNLTGVSPAGFTANCSTPSGAMANRSFFYDSLGRLIKACNPETQNNYTTYAYDNNSNLTGRTDGRNVNATTRTRRTRTRSGGSEAVPAMKTIFRRRDPDETSHQAFTPA